ncbi:MAG: DNA-binding response OmpR family regulator [Flavobacteriales bacterium]|jgi:DNA-binding response OmpR family regulator
MKTKLLLIDDEVITLRMTKIMLNQHQFDVETCLTTSEAISVLTSCEIDLILLDISMPTIDGFDFIKLMSSLHIRVPVIFLSNQNDDYTVKMALSEGVKRCVSKNAEITQLPSIINEVLNVA